MSSSLYFRRVSALATSLIITAGALAGCAAKNPLVGKWSTPMPAPATGNMTMEFKADGTDTMALQGSLTIAGKTQNLSQSQSGTYTVQDDTLTMTSAPSHAGAAAPAPESAKFKIDGDTLTVNDPKSPKPLVMTRVKE